MTLINPPGHEHRLATASIDAGFAADIASLLIELHGLLFSLVREGEAPAAAAQLEAMLAGTGSSYDLATMTDAILESWQTLDHVAGEAFYAIRGYPAGLPGNF